MHPLHPIVTAAIVAYRAARELLEQLVGEGERVDREALKAQLPTLPHRVHAGMTHVPSSMKPLILGGVWGALQQELCTNHTARRVFLDGARLRMRDAFVGEAFTRGVPLADLVPLIRVVEAEAATDSSPSSAESVDCNFDASEARNSKPTT
jgi:hypothetical protein